METKSLVEIARALYLGHDDSKTPITENMEEIRMINVLRAESYVKGGLKVINSIKEILSVGCDDVAFEEMLRDRIDLLLGDYEVTPKYKKGSIIKYKSGDIEGIGKIAKWRRDYSPATLESKIRYIIEGVEGHVFDEKELKVAE